MPILHICNTQFEWELAEQQPTSLLDSFAKHPVFEELQFLPCLYAAPEDGFMATGQPDPLLWEELHAQKIALPQLHLFSTSQLPHYECVESWGASPSVAEWARKKGLSYPHPPWDVVKEVNSKAFSFAQSPKLPGAALLTCESDARAWLHQKNVVFKTCFGLSGKGHFIQTSPDPVRALAFLHKEWKASRPVIAEPWVERLLDFSTQWKIGREIEYLGPTLCENDAKGKYLQTKIDGTSELAPFLSEHQSYAFPLLQEMAKRGYFGHVGIDAMVYLWEEKTFLHPIVEINARKTMGWVALMLQKRYFPEQTLTFTYSPRKGFTFNVYKS